MSDPITNIEIDDVLSSIRRLVSEQPEKAPRPAPGKLVLTQALRVDDPGPEAGNTANAGGDDDGGAPSDFETADRPDTPRQAGDGNATQDTAQAAADAPTDRDPDTAEADSYSLEQRITELEQAIAASAGDWEPDGTEAGAGTLPQDMPPVFGLAATRTRPWTEPGSPGARGTAQAEPTPEAPRPMGQKFEQGQERGSAPTPQEADRPSMFEDDGEETVLDEEMLRDLVAELVREELQGALGERITRNVRKLVRAEIQRALAARDLG